jgi:hypothetical protein
MLIHLRITYERYRLFFLFSFLNSIVKKWAGSEAGVHQPLNDKEGVEWL